ncbi:hypothetical protein A2U01_0094189, partial [Trifolium medium]|nr:hypothetical protein [Trifolium medium]
MKLVIAIDAVRLIHLSLCTAMPMMMDLDS